MRGIGLHLHQIQIAPPLARDIGQAQAVRPEQSVQINHQTLIIPVQQQIHRHPVRGCVIRGIMVRLLRGAHRVQPVQVVHTVRVEHNTAVQIHGRMRLIRSQMTIIRQA